MNKKGFTLIELLAVIIILGILMIIAIPAVTSYINNSRKSAYVDTAKEIIGAARNKVNDKVLKMYDTNATYYIPVDYVKTENDLKSPYGKFEEAYVVVIYDGEGYKYYWISIDETGTGVDSITPYDKLDEDDIKSDLKVKDIQDIVNTTGIGDREKILILDSDTEEWKEVVGGARNHVSEEDGGKASGGGSSLTAAETIGQVSGLVTNAGAKRYVGSNPDNYVSFNNGELWRIIGVYGNNLKIIRSSRVKSGVLNSSTVQHIWSESEMCNYLNNSYYNNMDDTAKQMINENASWSIGEVRYDHTASQAYEASQSDYWTGKVGLLSSYEYMYGTSDASCYEKTGNDYKQGCVNSDWLALTRNEYMWLMDPSRNNSSYGIHIILSGSFIGDVNYSYPGNQGAVIPAVYLKSSVKITGGSGTSTDPYTLGM